MGFLSDALSGNGTPVNQFNVDNDRYQDKTSAAAQMQMQSAMNAARSQQTPLTYSQSYLANQGQAANAGPAQLAGNVSTPNDFRQQMLGLSQQLQQSADGRNPSIADLQMRQGQDRTAAQQMAMAASTGGQNASLAARAAVQNAAMASQQTAAQAGAARIAEQDQAVNQLSNVLGQGAQYDLNQTGQQIGQNQFNASAVNNQAALNAQLYQQMALANQAAQNSALSQNAQLGTQVGLANQAATLQNRQQINQVQQAYQQMLNARQVQDTQNSIALDQARQNAAQTAQGQQIETTDAAAKRSSDAMNSMGGAGAALGAAAIMA